MSKRKDGKPMEEVKILERDKSSSLRTGALILGVFAAVGVAYLASKGDSAGIDLPKTENFTGEHCVLYLGTEQENGRMVEQNRRIVGHSLTAVVNAEQVKGAGILHVEIYNQLYGRVRQLVASHPQEREAALNMQQPFDDSTPLFCAMGVAAPGDFVREMMTKENVVLPARIKIGGQEVSGITPLMLAASGFVNGRTVDKLIEKIGSKRIQEEFRKKDSRGWTAKNYAAMSKEQRNELLRAFHVNGDKAENHCVDRLADSVFFPYEKDQFITYGDDSTERVDDLFQNAGFKTGTTSYKESSRKVVLATKANVRKLIELATAKSGELQFVREVINQVNPELKKLDKRGINRYWKKVNKEMGRLIKEHGELSDVSLLDAIEGRVAGNLDIIQQFVRNIEAGNGASAAGQDEEERPQRGTYTGNLERERGSLINLRG